MDSVKCFNVKNGINLYYIPVDKFKTLSVSLHIHRPLRREEASANALLTDVLKRGCRKYPDSVAIERYTQELYGAYFDADVRKKGEDQILTFGVNVIGDQYALGSGDLMTHALDLLMDVVLDPLVVDGGFRPDYVEQEKANLKNDIEAIINDKRTYASLRTIQILCEGEPYAVHELGTVEDVDKITPQSLYEQYKTVLREGPMDVFVTGDADIGELCDKISSYFADVNPTVREYPKTALLPAAAQPREVTECFDVAQAKLCMGFTTGISPADDNYYPLMVYSGILGGGAHSKLFNNVREKLSLAYYCGSRLERFKGLMVISAGIEIANKQQAIDEINVQLDAMRKGDISDYEYQATIKGLVNSINSIGDDIHQLEDYYVGQMIGDKQVSLGEFAQRIAAVTVEDVVRVSARVTPGLTYILTGKEGAAQ